MASATPVPALEVRDITKRFPGVLANDHISFTLLPGEIHALLGENGAGKSTLMNIIYGLYEQDKGEILVHGKEVEIDNPNDAIARGIGMVHQHFMLVPTLTVTENIILGNEVTNGPVLDRKQATRRIRELSERYGLEVDPNAYVRDISVGHQQRVEIVKALYRGADILILDEPTAVLTPQEADDLFLVIRSLAEQGKSIIFITHKLREVLELADRITVLRHGRVVGTTTPEEATRESLASMMVGRDVALVVEKEPARPDDTVLDIEDIVVKDDRGLVAVDGVSLEVRAGEILGVAGVQGNGQTELVEAIVGLRTVEEGMVRILERDVTNAAPRRITELGVAHIPEDRQADGLVGAYPVADNLVLNTYYHRPFARGIVMNEPAIHEQAKRLVEKFDVRTPSIETPAGSLSGGNQQKVIVAREFSRPVKLIVAAQPTRGIDVGSIEFIHTQLILLRDEGAAVLLVSAELDEILALADRIAVMYRGKIIATFPREEATRDRLGLLMAGVEREEDFEHKMHAPVTPAVAEEREVEQV
ncbi:MAG: ABC transporter ATP-binding protein [Chloroflexota bacterium]|nr:ABC transporter ATP-binding protein [Chloroflexota bacterium]